MPQTDLEFLCSAVSYSVILWTVAGQAPLSMEFSRQEYWSGLPFPTPGDLLDPGVKNRFPSELPFMLVLKSHVKHHFLLQIF